MGKKPWRSFIYTLILLLMLPALLGACLLIDRNQRMVATGSGEWGLTAGWEAGHVTLHAGTVSLLPVSFPSWTALVSPPLRALWLLISRGEDALADWASPMQEKAVTVG